MGTWNITWEDKGGRCVGLSLQPPCLESWSPHPSGTLRANHRPVQGFLYMFTQLHYCIVWNVVRWLRLVITETRVLSQATSYGILSPSYFDFPAIIITPTLHTHIFHPYTIILSSDVVKNDNCLSRSYGS